MDNKLIQVTDSVPVILKNTHLNISLQGWPAAITAITFFGSCVAIYALKVTHPDQTAGKEATYAEPNAA